MDETPRAGPPAPHTDRAFERQLREMNEALLIASVHQHELTEQAQKAEALVRESHNRFEALFDNFPFGMYLVDAELRIRLVSRIARSVFGVGDLIGKDFDAVIHTVWPPRVADEIVARFRHTLETGETYTAPEFAEERQDRQVREYYYWQIQRIALPDDQYGVVCYFIDISTRVLAEQSLRQSEEGYRQLFEGSRDAILILDGDTGKITDANPFIQDLIHYTHAELMDKELWEIGLFQDKTQSKSAMRELQKNGYIRYEDMPLRTQSGTMIEVEFVSNTYTVDGRQMVQCNIRDITQRRKTELALAKALVYADDIIATLREPFVVLDYDLRVKTANRSFYDSFQVSKEETENRLVYNLGNGQWDIPALRKLLDEVLSRNQSVHDFEVEHSFPALGRKTMLLNARPFPPDSKHPELILLAVEDVSAVRERADELAAANLRKDEFLAMLGHELRNPFAAILHAVQLLRLEQGKSSLQQQAHNIIERQLGQLVHLVDDLLEVSRISTGRIHLQRKQMDMRAIVECGMETVRPLIEQRRHAVAVRLPPSPIWLDGDPTRLEQVVVNLLNNAAKYTDEGGQIWLSLQQEGNEAVLRVQDSGIGIPPELMPHIFDLFTQAERSLARSQGGLGIGLSLVQRLVEMHGGTIAASSAVGQGSEFVVHLPVLQTAEPRQPSPPTQKTKPIGPALRVLVVDDNVDTADTLAILLRHSGHEVRTAHDGPAALEAALDFRPNAVLLDIGLPGLDGFEVAKRMRQQPVLQNVVLVAMTGYGQESDRRHSQQAGFDDHLVKPADLEQIQKVLATVSEPAT